MERRENNFDFLRLFFAILVIFCHSYILLRADKDEPFLRWTNGQVDGGGIAVDCFFILSGYLITASFLRSKSVWSYLGKRSRRIFPGLLAAYVVGAWLVPMIADFPMPYRSTPTGILHFLEMTSRMRALYIHGAFASNPDPNIVNNSIWTIPYEFTCYVLIAMLGVAGLFRRRALLVAVFLLSLVVGSASPIWGPVLSRTHLGLEAWARFIPFYLAGTVAWVFRERIRVTSIGVALCVVSIVIAAAIPFTWNPVFACAGTYLVLAFGGANSIRLHSAARYGDFSYGTYLYAWPVQQCIILFTGVSRPWPLFLMATIATAPFAIASWYLIERPFLASSKAHTGEAAREQGAPIVASNGDEIEFVGSARSGEQPADHRSPEPANTEELRRLDEGRITPTPCVMAIEDEIRAAEAARAASRAGS